MAKTINERMTAEVNGDFVVFLIGMRINRLWKIHKWLPVAMAMPKILNELTVNPDIGLMGFQSLGTFQPVIVQYWKSFEHLEKYARDKNAQHYPAWKAFNAKIKNNGYVGIWHETYKIRAGEYECIYHNMPKYGLGKIGSLIPAIGNKSSAAQRMLKN